MNQKFFTLNFLFFLCSLAFTTLSFSNNCLDNNCVIDLPTGMPDDTLFLSSLSDGTVGVFYDDAVSFRMPLTTTPVNEIDPDIPAGLTIDQIEITSITNLPSGISWEADQTVYIPADDTDGCLRFFGTPFQAGTYLIEVNVEATILVFSQEATFFIELVIEPSTSITEGFTMMNNTGCGEVVVSFENNISSNGEDGFSYQWDFGNGNTSIDENPDDQTYSTPGTYIVNYSAEIDTVGYILTRVQVTAVTCDDIPTAPDWSFNPDMRVEIRNPSGDLIYTSNTVWNTDPPIDYFPNINLESGNYEIKVIDEDSGINGNDDVCGQVPFNQFSNGPIITGDFNLHLDIIHPIEVVQSTDTVWVFEIPDAPIISDVSATSFCEGEMPILNSSYATGNQWLLDGIEIIDAVDQDLELFESGLYSVVYTNEFGCSAESDAVEIEFYESPEEPEYFNSSNLLSLLESIDYPINFTFQWYQNNDVLVGETEQFYCAMEDGDYMLEVIDPATGCVSTFVETIIFDAEAECFVGTEDLTENWNLQIYPNPVFDHLNISFESIQSSEYEITVYDLFGRRFYHELIDQTGNSSINTVFQLNDLMPGMYLLQIKSGDHQITQKFVKK